MVSYVDFLREHGGLLSLNLMLKLDADFASAGVGGTIVGPGFSTPGNLVIWNDTLGKLVANGPLIGTLAGLNTVNDAQWAGAALALNHGGSGATDAAGARAAFGLGALAVLDTITASLVTDFDTHARSVTATQLVAGTNVNITPVGNTLVFSASLTGGTVSGPGVSVNSELVLFNGTSGGIIKESGCVPSANGLSLLAAANYAAMRTLLGLGALALQSTITASQISDPSNLKPPEALVIPISDETTILTTGTAKVTFRMPYAFTVSAVRASLTVASSSGLPTFNIKESGVTILSTLISIDATEKTSTTAATPPVISDPNLADDAEMTIDITIAGTGAVGAKIYLIGQRA